MSCRSAGETIDALRELALDRRTTVFTVVHAALAVLLARRAGVDEIVIGTRVLTRQVDAGAGTVVTLRSLVDDARASSIWWGGYVTVMLSSSTMRWHRMARPSLPAARWPRPDCGHGTSVNPAMPQADSI